MTDQHFVSRAPTISEGMLREMRKRAFKKASSASLTTFWSLIIPTLLYLGIAALFTHDPLDDNNGYIPPDDCPIVETQTTSEGIIVADIPVDGKCVRLDKKIKKGQWLQLVSAIPIGVSMSGVTKKQGVYPFAVEYANMTAVGFPTRGAQFLVGKRNEDTTYFSMMYLPGALEPRAISFSDNYGALLFVIDNHAKVLEVGSCTTVPSKQPIYVAVNVIPNPGYNQCKGFFRVELRILKEYCGS